MTYHYAFFLRDFTRATKLATHLSIIFPFPSHTHLFCPLSFHPCVSKPFRLSLNLDLTLHADGNTILLTCAPFSTSSTVPPSFSVGLWNCQSAVNKADFISAFSLQSTLSILGLTETWIRPEDSATPAALSNNFSFSHTPRQVVRGGGTGLLISNNWKYSTYSRLCNNNSFESHVITVIAPIKLQIVVIYHPPGQTLATFLERLDGVLSSFVKDGIPLLIFDDFNINLEKHYATDFHSLLASFDLERLTTTSTHKSGNQLDLIYTRNCTRCHQPLYRLLLNKTYAPFLPPIFPL